ncbi:hypothetical protein A6A06_25085 [Streptomyces sp. CB02923]|nr:hypothetical protein A6A06_25085 [Streptomyces sp. CB02923]
MDRASAVLTRVPRPTVRAVVRSVGLEGPQHMNGLLPGFPGILPGGFGLTAELWRGVATSR